MWRSQLKSQLKKLMKSLAGISAPRVVFGPRHGDRRGLRSIAIAGWSLQWDLACVCARECNSSA